MSDDNGRRAQPHWQDAFTLPSWQIPELDEAILAPRFEDFDMTDFRAPRDLPKLPDVDEILRGEYTGWIPVIREGESLEQVQAGQQTQETLLVTQHVEEIVQIVEVVEQHPEVQSVESTQQSTSSSPWLVVETFEYGHQALHEVPVPAQPTCVSQPQEEQVVQQPIVQPTPIVQPEPEPIDRTPQPSAQHAQPDAFNDTFDTSSWNPDAVVSEPSPPRPTQSIDATLVAEATGTADHSLELVIMRDEIQDLRNRLDASQKLVEEMMHKLANLAELALRSRM
jgi:hypothetical protein